MCPIILGSSYSAEASAPAIAILLDDLAHTLTAAQMILHEDGDVPGEAVATEDGTYRLAVEMAPIAAS